MARKASRHLYTNVRQRRANLRSFKHRYGAKRGAAIYGAVVGKVRREQAAEGTRKRKVWVSAHRSHSRLGKITHVKGHYMRLL